MARTVVGLDATAVSGSAPGAEPGLLSRAPEHVQRCLTWQLDPVALAAAQRSGDDPAATKRDWLRTVAGEWGTPGQAVVVDDAVVACLLYAPAAHLPGAVAFPTAPVSPDAVLLAGVVVDPAYRGRGLGKLLVQAMARDLLDRYGVGGSVRAVEAITATPLAGEGSCAPPDAFCGAVGFRERRGHPRHPRMRLDLRTCVTWRDEVEQVLERLRAGVRAPLPRPVPSTREPRAALSRGSRGPGRALRRPQAM